MLSLSNGAFPLRDGNVLKVDLGDKTHSLIVASRALLVALPVSFVGTVNIEP